jgi:hypothetical protein
MLRAEAPDILHIATHPDSHAHYCELAAACKVPVAVCEKPLADTLRGARRIAALHAEGKIKILTNHERRYSADYIRAKAILDGERLGPLLSVRACLYMGKTRRLLDVLWHDGTHLADAVMFLTGRVIGHKRSWGAKPKSREGSAFLEGMLRPPEQPPSEPPSGRPLPEQPPSEPLPEQQPGTPPLLSSSLLPSSPPLPFLMELGAGRDHLVFELEFSCAQGRLRIGNGIFEVWESAPSPYAEQFRSLKKTEEGFNDPTGYFANMMADAAACVRDPLRRPRSSAMDGLRVIEYLRSVRAWR